ncbi:TonB-dependent receptor [Novosphingobium sp. JCM 18896]|uniref:TonB-dependent receptor n=1 Tax=Novosphingobium sp. JCM 18896 TaxID=2989731 RepID=UPI002221E0C9|nr:TonB-dependent receptor [Novosphingobium sp. JCM 18896]
MRASILFALSASTALGALSPAMAQDASGDAGDIIVTARRTEERLQDVPISITVYNQQQLNERNVVSANDLATYTPSLSANSRFGNETASFAIRGFVQEAQTAPSVAVYFADVVAARGQPSLAGANNVPSGSFMDLQNVQVLKGPQGTLFGRNTTGGAVLLVPQKPTDRLEGFVEGSIGNYDMKRGQAVLNIPLSDTFRVRLGVDRMKRDGYLKNRSGIGPDDFNDVDYLYFRGSVVGDLTPDLENYLIFTYAKSDTNGNVPRLALTNTQTIGGVPCAPGVGPTGAPITGAGALIGPLVCAQQSARFAGYGYYDVENSNPDAHLDAETWQVVNTTTLKASDTLTVKNIASYVELRQSQSANLFGDNIRFPTAGGLPFGYVNVYSDPNYDTVSQYTFTEELQLQGNSSDGKFTYQVGAYYEKSGPISRWQGTRTSIFASCTDVPTLQCTDVLRNPLTGAPGGFVQNTLTRYNFENIGFYGQASYKFTDQLSLTGGIRYTIDKAEGTGSVRTFIFPAPNVSVPICGSTGAVSPQPEGCLTTLRQESKRPTWLIGLDYKPTDDLLIYGKYARGYRQGGVNPSNTLPIVWGPEKVDSFEVGAKASFHGSVNGYFNISAFYNDFSDQQLQANLVPLPGTTASPSAAIVNAGKSKIQGVEVEALISPVEGLRFSGGYTYLDTQLKSYSPPNFPLFQPPTPTSQVGGDLALSPRHKLTVTGSYTLPLDESVGKITFGATYTYTGTQIASADSPLGRLPSTNLVNLNASWEGIAGTPIDLSLFATNVTKEKYPVYVGGTYYSAGIETLLIGQPRMYGMRLRYSFGK